MRAHWDLLLVINLSNCMVEKGDYTSTDLPFVTFLTSSRRLRSQRRTWPSEEAESKVLNEREVARVVTVDLWPKRQALGVMSTDLATVTTAQTLMVQSTPAVIRVRESAKIAPESCLWCMCSDRPTSCTCQIALSLFLGKNTYLLAICSVKSYTPICKTPLHVFVVTRRKVKTQCTR